MAIVTPKNLEHSFLQDHHSSVLSSNTLPLFVANIFPLIKMCPLLQYMMMMSKSCSFHYQFLLREKEISSFKKICNYIFHNSFKFKFSAVVKYQKTSWLNLKGEGRTGLKLLTLLSRASEMPLSILKSFGTGQGQSVHLSWRNFT